MSTRWLKAVVFHNGGFKHSDISDDPMIKIILHKEIQVKFSQHSVKCCFSCKVLIYVSYWFQVTLNIICYSLLLKLSTVKVSFFYHYKEGTHVLSW